MDGIVTNSIFYIVLGIFILSFRKTKEVSGEPMGRDASRQIKGIAIMAVLLGHMAIIFKLINLPVTPYLGAQGVDLFLFLSAFGLTASFSKKGLAGFFKKRLIVIFVPYIIFNIVRIPIMITSGIKMIIVDILKSLIALDVNFDPSMWYVQYILIWYVIFFIVFAIKPLKITQKAYTLLAIGLILLVATIYIFNNNIIIKNPIIECQSHHLAFPLGALFFLVYERVKKLSGWKYLIVSGVSLLIFLSVSPQIPRIMPYYLSNISFLVFVVFLFMFVAKSGYKSKLLGWLGDLAYYIYLNELFVMFVFGSILKLSGGVAVGAILLTTVILGILTKLLSDKLIKK